MPRVTVAAAPAPRTAGGQVLVLVALLLVIVLAFAGLAIDVGRQVAERRHVQTAADAAALAACSALIDGASDNAAAADARQTALVNLEHSPAGAAATVAGTPQYESGHAGDPSYLSSGILINGTSVRVAISSTLQTTLGKAIGIQTMATGGRARCSLQGGPALPLVARRYINAPGPGNGFVDTVSTAATSGNGQVDQLTVMGYDVRTPASEANPGPVFDLYGPGSKSSNDSSFRGFVALDVRNFESTTSRVYYNGVTSGTTVNTLKDVEGAYILTGYRGPMFPPITTPADPDDQVAVLDGNDTAMVVGNFQDVYVGGERLLLGVYNGTVMQIPDFAISPPGAITIDSTATITGPNFTVSRNDAFNSTVTLHLHGDHDAPNPAWDLIPGEPPSTSAPTAGHMNMPTWSSDVFIPAKQGTTVTMNNLQTQSVPTGIYTVWLEGHSGNPYFQARRYPVPVMVGGATRDFSLGNSTLSGSTPTPGGSISLPIYVSTTSASGTKWGATGSPVALSYDTASFTDCSLNPDTIGAGQITLSDATVTPTTSGSGALSTLTINTVGLAAGCYRFNLRATGSNGDGQPVVHVQPITFNVATSASNGSYVDIIGFAVFQVTNVDANGISAEAVTGVYADPDDQSLRRAEKARLIPW
ncbi:MAG: pilus assembly protein TadG-related protein [Chloroflexota bacterium]|nr:pilus assembly protein TadG-related protein [Chloroflexota bacterium]